MTPAERYERLVAAAIEATNASPLDGLAGQRERYELAKRVAEEVGSAIVSVLPIVNGRYHARAGRPPITPIHDCGDGYSTGYLWQEGS